MRLRLTAVFVCLLAGNAGAFERETEEIDGVKAVAREVIVKFHPGRAAAAATTAAAADAEHSEAVGDGDDLRLIRSRSKNVATLLKELSARPDVEFAEPNYILQHAATPSDPSYPGMWGLRNTGAQYGGVAGADIDAPAAWDITTGSPNVAVGIIDTGVDLSHPDLQANLWSAPSQFTVTVGGRNVTCPAGSRGFDAFTFTCNPRDDQGHGTHVAGTVGATGNNGLGVTGVNWRTKIVAVRTMNAANTGTAVEAINGIDFLIQANAYFAKTATPLNVRVMSASWFIGGPSYTLYLAIQRAQTANILFVAAAGNSNLNTDYYKTYPAGYDLSNIIAVAATDTSDNKASFSSYGAASVDLGAPGTYILSTKMGGSYGLMQGTSMATPHVSGAAALVLSKCALSTAQLKDALLRNVDIVPGLSGKTVTGGRLNVYKALRSCAGTASSFTIGATPSSRTLAPGQSTTYSLSLVPQNGFTGAVSMSVTGAPAGVTTSFSSSVVSLSGTASPVLNVSVGASTLPGTYTLLVKATGNGITQQTPVTLVVGAAKSFTLTTGDASQSVAPGSMTYYSVAVAPQNGFSGAVALTVTGAPAGVAVVMSPSTVSVSTSAVASTLYVGASASTAPGTYSLAVTAAGGGVSRTLALSLNVGAAPTFTLAASTGVSVVAGQIAYYTLQLSAGTGFSSTVALSASGLPSGATATFSLNPLVLSSTASTSLRVTTSSSAPAGTYYLTVTASGGGISRTVRLPLTVSAPVVAPAPTTTNLPAAPINPSVVRMYSTQTQFRWTAGSTNQTGFQVEACQGVGCNFYTKISGTFPASATSMTHNPVYVGQVWSYRVRAVNSYGVSAWSPVVTIAIQ